MRDGHSRYMVACDTCARWAIACIVAAATDDSTHIAAVAVQIRPRAASLLGAWQVSASALSDLEERALLITLSSLAVS
ncbi:hypothetical protein GCM10009619_41780 [Williamsia maris]